MNGETWSCFGEPPTSVPPTSSPAEHVRVALAPRRVGDLCDHVLDVIACLPEAVVEAHRVKAVTARSQVREQPDRARRPHSGPCLHDVAHAVGERAQRVSEVVAAAEANEPCSPPHEPAVQQPRQLLKVYVGQREAVAELVPAQLESPVANSPFVDAAGARGRRIASHRLVPKRSATRSALTTPSSWNPDPQ